MEMCVHAAGRQQHYDQCRQQPRHPVHGLCIPHFQCVTLKVGQAGRRRVTGRKEVNSLSGLQIPALGEKG
jgi:hypothetical protein